MEKDRYLPIQGIPRSKLTIDTLSGSYIAVRLGKREELVPEQRVLSGGEWGNVASVKSYVVYEAKRSHTEDPLGY